MTYNYITFKGTEYCNVFVDKTTVHGILRFTHEISVTFCAVNDEWKFHSAWHIGASDQDWRADEEDSFEQTFPGLLSEIRSGLKAIIPDNASKELVSNQ